MDLYLQRISKSSDKRNKNPRQVPSCRVILYIEYKNKRKILINVDFTGFLGYNRKLQNVHKKRKSLHEVYVDPGVLTEDFLKISTVIL